MSEFIQQAPGFLISQLLVRLPKDVVSPRVLDVASWIGLWVYDYSVGVQVQVTEEWVVKARVLLKGTLKLVSR